MMHGTMNERKFFMTDMHAVLFYIYRKKEERKRVRKEKRKVDTLRVENAVSDVNVVLVLYV
jgi:hypothetical protein